MFKKFIVIFLLTVFSVRPAYFAGYLMYYETHLSEIIEKYCVNKDKPELQCNGKCHLAKELSVLSENTDNQDATSVSVIAFFPVYFHEITEAYKPLNFIEILDSYKDYTCTYKYLLSARVDKPPIV